MVFLTNQQFSFSIYICRSNGSLVSSFYAITFLKLSYNGVTFEQTDISQKRKRHFPCILYRFPIFMRRGTPVKIRMLSRFCILIY